MKSMMRSGSCVTYLIAELKLPSEMHSRDVLIMRSLSWRCPGGSQSQGSIAPTEKVCKLNKSLYGFK